SLAHALLAQGRSELADLLVQLRVAEHARLAGLALPDNRGLVTARAGSVLVEARLGDIELGAEEPAGVRDLPFQEPVPGLPEDEALGLAAPERLGIGEALPVQLVVLGSTPDPGPLRELRRWRVAPRLVMERLDGFPTLAHGGDHTRFPGDGGAGPLAPCLRPS